ncbi:polysaccharide deacetylase family protein [Peijinzhouia sedimentorum]
MFAEKFKKNYGRLFKKQIIKNWKNGSLYVLNYHSTPKEQIDNFKKQLEFLSTYFEFISPRVVAEKNLAAGEKPRLLLTFDDGILSNMDCLDLLDKFNVKALFFVVPNFIKAIEPQKFYRQNIRFEPHDRLEITSRDMSPISIKDLSHLVDRGHTIGHHTASHDLREISKWDEDKIEHEIISSKNELEKEINFRIDYFASPIDSRFILNSESAKTLTKNYALHFTTFAGANKFPLDKLVKRINIETYFSIEHIIFSMSKFELLRWKMRLRNMGY